MVARAPTRGAPLDDRLASLDAAIALAEGRAEPGVLADVKRVRSKVDERLARGEQVVVAAFAGGTGTGKSSLFNAAAGERIAETGVRRPTTDEPQALVAGDLEEATPVLDWLGVRRRHVTDPDGLPGGLVLVDLPDHDSVAAAHRETSARLTERVDLLVWVVDPLKYARSDLHHEALRPLAEHADVLAVVLNHADALSPDDRRACADDLRRVLAEEGLAGARVLVTSARTGDGLADLRSLLVEEGGRRRAVAARVAADVRGAAKALRVAVLRSGAAPEPDRLDLSGLVRALGTAAAVDGRAEAAAAEYRRSALAATRALLSGLVVALWGLVVRGARGARSLLDRPTAGRAAPAQRAAPVAVNRALLEVTDALGGGLAEPARERLRAAAGVDAATLGSAVGRAADAVTLRPRRRRWWAPLRWLLSLVEVAALVGALWLTVAAVVDWLRLPELPVPLLVGELPWPTALLLGGLVGRILGGIARRRAVRVGAARHRRAVRDRLDRAIGAVVTEHVAEPLRAEIEALARLDEALGRAAR